MSRSSLKPITLVPLPAPAPDAPAASPGVAAAGAPVTSTAPVATEAPRPINVLLLVHNTKLREIVRRLRDDARYYVEEAQGHQAALTMLASGPVRVAVLDCTPPYLGGWTLLGRVTRAAQPHPQTGPVGPVGQADLTQPGDRRADLGRHTYLLVVAGDQDAAPSIEGIQHHLLTQVVAWPCSFEQVQEAVSRAAAMMTGTPPRGGGGATTA